MKKTKKHTLITGLEKKWLKPAMERLNKLFRILPNDKMHTKILSKWKYDFQNESILLKKIILCCQRREFLSGFYSRNI